MTTEHPAAPETERCPDCRHAPHDSLGFCPNMASDNDCACTHGAPAAPETDVSALTEAEWDDLRAENMYDTEEGVRGFVDNLIRERLRVVEGERREVRIGATCPNGSTGACDSIRCGSTCSNDYDRMHPCMACVLDELRVTTARAESVEADLDALRAGIEAMRRVVDDEVANLADDGARLSHSVVRRMEAVLAPLLPGDGR